MNLPAGFTSRPTTIQDLGDVAALLDAYDIAYYGEAEANRSMLQFEWGAAWFDVERDSRIVHAADGTLVAYATHATPDPSARYEAWGAVDPRSDGKGIGSAIIEWAEVRTRSLLGPGSSTPLWNAAPATNAAAFRLFEACGYVPIRTFWEMAMELDPSFEAGPVPPGVTIRPLMVDVDLPAAFAVLNTAFETHFGYFEETFEVWLAQQQADETWDPSLGFVAERDGRIVGASNNGVIDGKGYVFELGVLPDHQGRGIGKALLRHSFAMLAAMGLTAGRLGVDSENVTGAVELYRSVGMEPSREHRVVEKVIQSG
ncbi:MAG: GNAT family N-acetyltransferase [Actinomycetota bacterium]